MATGDKYEGDWESGKKNGKGSNLFIQVFMFLPTVIFTKENFRMETDREKVLTLGLTKATTEANG